MYRSLSRDLLEESLGPCKGNASDGDARRRKLHLGQSCDTKEGARFKPVSLKDGFLFSAAIREDGLVQNYSDQDYIHNHKKLDRHLDHQARTLYIGKYPVHRNFFRSILETFTVHRHGLRNEDVNKKDVMNWASCQRTAFPKVRDCLLDLYHGNNVPANNLVLGLWVFLDIIYHYMEIFVSLRASLEERIANAGYVVHFLGIWRNYIIMSEDLCLLVNFISRETFQDVLLSCHFAVMLIIDFAENYPYLECPLQRTGTDGCEVFFSENGSWVKNRHAYSILDMVRNHAAMTRLAEIKAGNERLHFRRAHSKQDKIWEKQYDVGERDQRCDLRDYPTRREALQAWRRGARKARDVAYKTGMAPINYDENDSDDDHSNDKNVSDNDSRRGKNYDGDGDDQGWFKQPYRNVKYDELFKGMITEKEIEEQEEQCQVDVLESRNLNCDVEGNGSEETTVSASGCEDVQDELIFSESQQAVSNVLTNQDSDSDTHEQQGHKPDIYIPEIKQYRFKSSVVRELSNHNKVSSDHLLRIRQSTANQVDNENVRDLTDRRTFGLFDNIVIESLDTAPQFYQIGQIVRMRRYIGNRKVEYIQPIQKHADQDKDIKLLVKMFNREGEDSYKASTITKEIDLKDIITHVNLIQSNELVKLSKVDVEYLATYFSSADNVTANCDDDGRRVHLAQSRSGRLRRVLTYNT